MTDRRESWSRREFVSGLTLAGTAGFAGIRPARVVEGDLPKLDGP